MRILGLRKDKERGRTFWKNDWMEFHPRFSKINFRVSPSSYFDNRAYVVFSLGWGQFYIHIPFIRSKREEDCEYPQYGFYFYGEGQWFPDTLVICKGEKNKHIYLPWSYDWVRTSLMLKDGTWEHETKGNRKSFYSDEWKEKRWVQTHPYKYTLANGKVQERLATIQVDEREWRPIWFKWTSLFKMVRTSIDIEFNDEVGERSGSWKGGTMGCSYNLLKEETPYDCLKRMERERKFT